MKLPDGTLISAHVDEQGRLVLPDEFTQGNGLRPGSAVSLRITREGLVLRPPLSQLQKVYIEPTSRCNLSCRTCIRNAWNEPLGHMDAATFERVLAGLAGLQPRPTIFFGGFGEPLMHPDIAHMVERAAGIAAHVELITNGILLKQQVSADLINAGLGTLWISLDGASPESYADVRLSNSLDGVLENIAAYRDQYRRLHGDEPDIGAVFVAMRRNIDELPPLVRQSTRLGISRYMVTNVLPYTPEMCGEVLYQHAVDDWGGAPSPWNPSVDMPQIDLNPITRETLLKLRAMQPGSQAERRNTCPFVEQRSMSIAWDGSVSPCLALLHAHTSYLFDIQRSVQPQRMGNVNSQPLMEIWRSEEYTRFRQKVEDFDFSPCTICAGCEMAEGNQEDCFGNSFPTCGGCLWARGVVRCP